MILATKTEVDEAKRALVEEVDGVAAAVARWQTDPADQKRADATGHALLRAEAAFEEYARVLETWAAGPDSTAPSTVGQEGR